MKKLPKSFYSWTTIGGATLASICFLIILFLILISTIFPGGSKYLGLFTYIILPVFLIIGLLLIPIGTWRKYRRDKKRQVQRELRFPKIDLNDPGQRMIVFVFLLGSAVIVLFTALGSYQAFHYTESNKFCGTLCHQVMSPEYSTYHQSAHARVACVECHVGSGAGWFVKSKLSGLHQVYAVLTHSYPTPIATPVYTLRPARETCEECHWPEKFYNRELISQRYYLSDQETTEWDITMLMKTGPEHKALAQKSGIHWHVNPDVKIEYVAADFKRDTIALVKYTNLKTGKVSVYRDTANAYTTARTDTLDHRVMDCIDCHNRPSHDFKSPIRFFDDAMSAGKIPRNLPDVKMEAMDILYNNSFPSLDSANRFIRSEFTEYYQLMYPEVYDSSKMLIDKAIEGIQAAYKQNIFPEMKTQWNAHLNYIGHLETNGCFRCHNDSFIDEEGDVISRDCDLCHEIKKQGIPGNMEMAGDKTSLEFRHPVNIKGKWKKVACVKCHKNLFE